MALGRNYGVPAGAGKTPSNSVRPGGPLSDGFHIPRRILNAVDHRDFEAFAEAIKGADHEVDLFGGAMIIAKLGDPEADAHATASRLDVIAEEIRSYAGDQADQDALAHAIDYQLFSVCGFHGAAEDYEDPRNSYLDQVVARRQGLPITLSLVYMEVAQRVGLQCDGIGFPGHFIVRYGDAETPVFVDPFQQGARIDRAELLSRLRSQRFGGVNPESFLCAVTRRQILQRMLNNLHMTFRRLSDVDHWLDVLELQHRLEPWNPLIIGERGMLNYRVGRHDRALDDLEAYVSAGNRSDANPGALRVLDQLRLRQGGSGEPR
jgi:regulator of sirC expression with transglutaminase-like and TPR domain